MSYVIFLQGISDTAVISPYTLFWNQCYITNCRSWNQARCFKTFFFFFNLISDAKISTHLRSNKIQKVPVPVDVNNHSDHYHLLWSLRDILFPGQAPNDWNGDGFKQSRHDVEQVHGTRVWWTRVWPFLRGFDVFHGRFRSVDGRTLLHQ